MSYSFVQLTVVFLQTGAAHQVPTWVEDPEEAIRLTRLTYSSPERWKVFQAEAEHRPSFSLEHFQPKAKGSKKKEPVAATSFKCRWCKDRVGGCLYCKNKSGL